MEDILASIKKIIADDTAPAPRSFSRDPIPESVRPRIVPRDDILDLTGALEPEAPAEPDMTEPTAPIVSEAAEQATRNALEALTNAAAPAADTTPAAITPGITVEQLASDLLRPMLKDWLDANLPAVVERIVSQEVARITGRN